MNTKSIILDALHFKRNALSSQIYARKVEIKRYETKLAPMTIFGHTVKSLTKNTCEFYIERINIADSEIKLTELMISEIDTIVISMTREEKL